MEVQPIPIGAISADSSAGKSSTHSQSPHQGKSQPLPPSSQQQSRLNWTALKGHGLYARDQEERQLLEAYRRCCDYQKQQQQQELTLVTGPSGTGKTFLVTRSLQPHVEEAGGFFITGKFDPLDRPEGYYPLVQAFNDFVDQLVQNQTKAQTRKRIQAVVTQLTQSDRLILDMIPALERITHQEEQAPNHIKDDETTTIDTTSSTTHMADSSNSHTQDTKKATVSSSTSSSLGTETRLIVAFQIFLRAVCTRETPLILFLDDIQWAKAACLNLLQELVKDKTIQGMMIVATCRGNEVRIDHPLSVMLRELEEGSNNNSTGAAVRINNVVLQALDHAAVHAMVSDALTLSSESSPSTDADSVRSLSDVVFSETGGNPFFVMQFLGALEEEGLLYLETKETATTPQDDQEEQQQQQPRWVWHTEQDIRERLHCTSASDLVTGKMLRLEKSLRDVLMLASCFGATFPESLLQVVAEKSVSTALLDLQQEGFIRLEQAGGGNDAGREPTWRFVHDQFQQCSHKLIPEQDRAQFHLQIGRKLWTSLSSRELYKHMYIVANQLRQALHLVRDDPDPSESIALALLLFRAGEKAGRSSKFSTAAMFFNDGISMLRGRHWRDEYELSLGLFNAAAEVEYCNGNFDRMSELLREALKNARNARDKTRTLTTSIYYLGSQRKLQPAIDLGFETLKDLGESFPLKPWSITISSEFHKTRKMLRQITDADIMNLPPLDDEDKLAATRLMILMFAYTTHGRPNLAPLIAMRLVQSTLKYGLSGMSCVGFAAFTLFLCSERRDPKLGLRLGHLSVQLVEKFKAKEWIPRVYSYVYGFCFLLGEPARDCLDPLLTAHRMGLGTGDIEYSNFAAGLYSGLALHASLPLPQVISDTQAFLEIMSMYNQQSTSIQFLKPKLQFAMNLAGLSKTPHVLSGDCMDEDIALSDALETKNHTGRDPQSQSFGA